MRSHLRLVATLLVGLAAYAALIAAMRLMSQESDRSLYLGIGAVVSLILSVPVIVRAIWRIL